MKLATLCYIQKENKTLMLHRTKRENDFMKDFWNGVGGKFEKDESPEECMIREVKEETGFTIQPKLKGILTFPNNRETGEEWYVFVYTADKFEGKIAENDVGELEWIDTAKLMELNLQGADKVFLPWVFEDKIFSAKFKFKDDKVESYDVSFY